MATEKKLKRERLAEMLKVSSNMKYINFNVNVLHLELTSRCNALCPMCGRTTGMDGAVEGGEVILKKRDDVELLDTDPKLLANMIEEMKPFIPNHVFINGNFGDPIMYPHLLEVVKMYKDAGVPQVTLSTNGSVHKPEWWIELASIMRKPDKVIFAVDGLEDTNHLYRVNTNFNKIMENAQAFIDAGGLARWDFIAFAHNEHQIEEAKELANKMGFVKFRYKKSNRYVIPTHYAGDGEEKVETKTELKFVAKQHVAMEKKKAKTTRQARRTPKEKNEDFMRVLHKTHNRLERDRKKGETDWLTDEDLKIRDRDMLTAMNTANNATLKGGKRKTRKSKKTRKARKKHKK